METIKVKGGALECLVVVGGQLNQLHSYLPADNVFIITDHHLYHIYGQEFPGFPVYVAEPGEQSKTMESARNIFYWLMEKGAGRNAFILGIGGGMVCDLAGFVASVFMRGVKYGFVATTLLAQADASIGGKNGINLDGYKNIIGTFNQPAFVLCDTGMLRSLPQEEIKSGLAEVVKHALIADKNMFGRIAENPGSIFRLEESMINYLVSRSVHIKSGIVSRDEREAGERRKLNLGHSWGHAVEKTDAIPHGKAVSIGIAFAAHLSEYIGCLKEDQRKQIVSLLESIGLPTSTTTNPMTIFRAMVKDKKRENARIHFVLIAGIGQVSVEPISLSELEAFVQTLKGSDTPGQTH